MDIIRKILGQPKVAGTVGFLIGAIFGLVVLGWWLWPVQWTDATPQHLRADLKEDYLRMVIDSYELRLDGEKALARWQELGEDGPALLAAVEADPGGQSPVAISQFKELVSTAGATQPASQPTGGARSWLPILCGVTLLLAAALVGVYLLRQRGMSLPLTPARQAELASREAQRTDFAAEGEEEPMAHFMATYIHGDDLFDDSFSIESLSGDFLGECGVGISDTIGVGEPKHVSAFEVWLFDKNDIQTVTKVLMSAHAFNDPATVQKLQAKGEPVLAEPGKTITLETATLRLVAKVVEMSYNEGPLPSESNFAKLTLELAVWQKPGATGEQPLDIDESSFPPFEA